MKFSEQQLEAYLGVEVTLQRSARRRTIGLAVTAEGKLVVTAPRGTPEEKIARLVEKEKAWIEREVAERKEALSLFQDGAVFFLGKPRRLVIVPEGKEAVELADGEIRMSAAGADIWIRLQTWYREEAEGIISQRVQNYAEQLRLEVEQIEIRDWKSKWGECRSSGILRFNWRAVLLPPEALDYLVVHELLHLREPSHQPRFWRFMAEVLPDYASRRSWLKRYSLPLLLWKPEGSFSATNSLCQIEDLAE